MYCKKSPLYIKIHRATDSAVLSNYTPIRNDPWCYFATQCSNKFSNVNLFYYSELNSKDCGHCPINSNKLRIDAFPEVIHSSIFFLHRKGL